MTGVRTMKAMLLKGHGGVEQLEYCDVPVPEPAAGEVLLRIAAAGLNNTDINLRTGWYSKTGDPANVPGEPDIPGAARLAPDAGWTGNALRFPRIQGVDACGFVVGVGEGVAANRIGERVLVDPVLRSAPAAGEPVGSAVAFRATYFGSDCNGAFAEYATVPARNAWRISSSLSDAQLASFPCAYGAAENMLERAGVVAGETVLVTGASGGVGSAAVQLARARGARVIALSSAAKMATVQALGAERVLARDGELLTALGRESIDVAIDVVGGGQFPVLLEILRRGGRYAVAGAIGGANVVLDLRLLYLKDLRLLGCTIFEPAVFGRLVEYIERGQIRPLVSATYELRELAAAQLAFAAKSHVGKIVLIPPSVAGARSSGQ